MITGKKKQKDSGYTCSECGYFSLKWNGKCPGCGSWNSFQEKNQQEAEDDKLESKVILLSNFRVTDVQRLRTGSKELDRVLGGGLVKGSSVLVGGEPGTGKSTLMLQICGFFAREAKKVLYISGEESLNQLKLRAERLNEINQSFEVLQDSNLKAIKRAVKKLKPDVMIVDSIQTLDDPDLDNFPGSPAQIKQCTLEISELSRAYNMATILIGHITKDGNIAGPKIVEHAVDTVLYFQGDNSYNQFRILRSFKNRFGAINEIGIFEMGGKGLRDVSEPENFFAGKSKDNPVPGAALTVSIEGVRPFVVDVEGLVTPTSFGQPQRNCVGFNSKKLNKIIAVLEKRQGVQLGGQDVFINIPGGLKMADPASELAVGMAIISSYFNKTLPNDVIFLGELGLTGELRAVANCEIRLKEIARLGYKSIILPAGNIRSVNTDLRNLAVNFCNELSEVVDFFF